MHNEDTMEFDAAFLIKVMRPGWRFLPSHDRQHWMMFMEEIFGVPRKTIDQIVREWEQEDHE